MQIIEREDLPSEYQEMMKTEQHHNHKIIKDDKGTLRWEQDTFIDRYSEAVGLNLICGAFRSKKINKNNEIYREFYRRLGYSLSGYWEIFYWDFNNDEAHLYQPPTGE